jgi:hypothetical protein
MLHKIYWKQKSKRSEGNTECVVAAKGSAMKDIIGRQRVWVAGSTIFQDLYARKWPVCEFLFWTFLCVVELTKDPSICYFVVSSFVDQFDILRHLQKVKGQGLSYYGQLEPAFFLSLNMWELMPPPQWETFCTRGIWDPAEIWFSPHVGSVLWMMCGCQINSPYPYNSFSLLAIQPQKCQVISHSWFANMKWDFVGYCCCFGFLVLDSFYCHSCSCYNTEFIRLVMWMWSLYTCCQHKF